jgi:hypothetical protein
LDAADGEGKSCAQRVFHGRSNTSDSAITLGLQREELRVATVEGHQLVM